MMENFHIDFLSVLPGLLSPQLSCIYSSVWLSYHSHQTTDTLIPVGKHVATNPEPKKPNTIQKLFFLLFLFFSKKKKSFLQLIQNYWFWSEDQDIDLDTTDYQPPEGGKVAF